MKYQCDVCGKMKEVTMVIMYGTETYACDECLGRNNEKV